MRGKKSNSKYFVDETKFSTIDSSEVAYMMGLLWADGYITNPTPTSRAHSVNILANKTDLEGVLPLFNKVGVWAVYERNSVGRQPRLHIQYTSKSLWKIFNNYGFCDKSIISAETILNHIPDELKHYWWRGYFDGDGCIALRKDSKFGRISFTGSLNQDWKFVYNLLNSLDIFKYNSYQRTSDLGSNSQISFGYNEQIEKFYKYIYSGDDLGFSRKKDKFELHFQARELRCVD